MNTDQRRRLEKLLNVQAHSRDQERMMDFMHDALEDAGMLVRRRDGQLYATKGNVDNPVPVFIAHADTVHRIVRDDWYAITHYRDPENGDRLYYAYDPTWKNMERGIGGDDKCGLFVCMEAAREFDDVGVIITRDEEIGALGASCIRTEDIAHAAVLIQADRRGARDAVRSTFGSVVISSDEWQSHVQESIDVHGYKWCDSGLFTDVTRLHENRTAKVSAINISAGYYNPHMPSEYISEYDLEWALALALDLGDLSAGKRWKHEHVEAHRFNRRGEYDEWAWINDDVPEDAYVKRVHGGWEKETPEEETLDDWLQDVARHRGEAITVTVNGIPKTFFPEDDDDPELWDGIRTSSYVVCEYPDCDGESVGLDNESGLWLCQEHFDEYDALDALLADKMRGAIKEGTRQDMIEDRFRKAVKEADIGYELAMNSPEGESP